MLTDELTLVNVLRNLSLVVDTIGILVGLDLIIGAPVIRGVNNLLSKLIDFDKSLNNSRTRIGLGIAFVVIAGIMMVVTLKTR